ncbi:hypothetical protein [Methylobacterium sp. WSM2598]|uniref:hypothetical protein n=1 Tax=Methylobacterium sp. WSM2598 TaxID=398261 RepID=UPI0012F6E460|nr:hypothetical protein [Methylobacterium sp. WSM2598]
MSDEQENEISAFDSVNSSPLPDAYLDHVSAGGDYHAMENDLFRIEITNSDASKSDANIVFSRDIPHTKALIVRQFLP